MADHELAKLVEAHHGAVVAIAFAVTRDLALAEDVAQETFVAAWGERGKLRDARNVRAWLCGIARNQARNAVRRRAREVGGEAADAVVDPEPSVLVGAVAREQTNELRAALDEIPETYREPLVLFYWQDKSIAQVASALAITEEAAQKRLSRARAYLRDELEAPLEQQGRGRRSAAAAAAAVLAMVASRSASAAAAPKGASMAIKAFGLLAAAGLAVGAVAMVRGRASDAAPASGDSAAREPATPVAMADGPAGAARTARSPRAVPGAPQLPAPDEEPYHGIALGKGRLPIAREYELSVHGPTSVGVQLAGGTSSVFTMNPEPEPAFRRHITGRVVDAAGKPIAGAIVIVDKRGLGGFDGTVLGAGGGKTSADGRFDAVVHDDAAGFAMALSPRGWSVPIAVPAGKDAAEVQLSISAPATLSVHVRQAGTPREADVTIRRPDGSMQMVVETDARGDAVAPLLGAGAYRIDVRPTQMFAGGTSDPVVREVTLTAGGAAEVSIDLPTGALVVGSAFKPGMETVEYFFYAGTDARDLASLKKLGRRGDVMNFLLGGQDADRGAEFHDVAPGKYMLCVDAATETAHFPFTCKQLDVPATKDTLEVAVEIPAR